MAKPGTLYVLTNPGMPGLIKLGKSGRGAKMRMSELYTTGVPYPFECLYAARFPNMDEAEKTFHLVFDDYRVNPKREFFDVDPEKPIQMLKTFSTEAEDITEEIQLEAEQVDPDSIPSIEIVEKLKKNRRERYNCFRIGIPQYSIITCRDGTEAFVWDVQTTLFARLVSDGNPRKISDKPSKKDGIYLQKLTVKLLGVGNRPLNFWYYKGRLLEDLYNEKLRMEE